VLLSCCTQVSILTGALAAEENSGVVGNEPSGSQTCNGGKQSQQVQAAASDAEQVLGSFVSPDEPLQPNNQAAAVTLAAASAAADTSPSTWRQVT